MANSRKESQLAHKISLFLDNELNGAEEQNFKEDMQRNSEVNNSIVSEQNFRRFLKQNFKYRSASPALLQAIKNNIKK